MSYSIKPEALKSIVHLTLTAEQLETISEALELYCIGLSEHDDPHFKHAADAQAAIIDVLECNFSTGDCDYKEIDADCYQLETPELQIEIGSDIPEHIEIEYITNGHQGGDAGYGGYTTLKIRVPSTGITLRLDSLNGGNAMEIDGEDTVEITVRGDWETSGFAEAFIELGKKLLEKINS